MKKARVRLKKSLYNFVSQGMRALHMLILQFILSFEINVFLAGARSKIPNLLQRICYLNSYYKLWSILLLFEKNNKKTLTTLLTACVFACPAMAIAQTTPINPYPSHGHASFNAHSNSSKSDDAFQPDQAVIMELLARQAERKKRAASMPMNLGSQAQGHENLYQPQMRTPQLQPKAPGHDRPVQAAPNAYQSGYIQPPSQQDLLSTLAPQMQAQGQDWPAAKSTRRGGVAPQVKTMQRPNAVPQAAQYNAFPKRSAAEEEAGYGAVINQEHYNKQTLDTRKRTHISTAKKRTLQARRDSYEQKAREATKALSDLSQKNQQLELPLDLPEPISAPKMESKAESKKTVFKRAEEIRRVNRTIPITQWGKERAAKSSQHNSIQQKRSQAKLPIVVEEDKNLDDYTRGLKPAARQPSWPADKVQNNQIRNDRKFSKKIEGPVSNEVPLPAKEQALDIEWFDEVESKHVEAEKPLMEQVSQELLSDTKPEAVRSNAALAQGQQWPEKETAKQGKTAASDVPQSRYYRRRVVPSQQSPRVTPEKARQTLSRLEKSLARDPDIEPLKSDFNKDQANLTPIKNKKPLSVPLSSGVLPAPKSDFDSDVSSSKNASLSADMEQAADTKSVPYRPENYEISEVASKANQMSMQKRDIDELQQKVALLDRDTQFNSSYVHEQAMVNGLDELAGQVIPSVERPSHTPKAHARDFGKAMIPESKMIEAEKAEQLGLAQGTMKHVADIEEVNNRAPTGFIDITADLTSRPKAKENIAPEVVELASPTRVSSSPQQPRDASGIADNSQYKVASLRSLPVPEVTDNFKSPAEPPAWRATKGESAYKVLRQWSRNAGVDLIWNSQFLVDVHSPVSLSGSYEEAVQQLLAQYQGLSAGVHGSLFVDDVSGKKTLVIETNKF